jgi:FO synthase subunit 2
MHPEFALDTFTDFIHWIPEVAPGVHIHAFSPDEVAHAAKRARIPTMEVISRLKGEGLGTIQGTAAEILVDSVRQVICPCKVSTADWVRIIKEAHNAGLRSTATIMYGSYETARDQAEHLEILWDIQDETHGFAELVTLPYVHTNTPPLPLPEHGKAVLYDLVGGYAGCARFNQSEDPAGNPVHHHGMERNRQVRQKVLSYG